MRARPLWSAVVLLTALSAAASAQQKVGFLLTTTSNTERFHTYWIVRDGGEVQIAEGMRLLVPRKSGWWEVGIAEITRVNSAATSEKVWAAPVGLAHPRNHVAELSDDDRCPDDINTYSVSWVGLDFVALHYAYESTCGAHPVSGTTSFMVKLDDLRHFSQQSRAQIALRDVAGPAGEEAMKLGAELAQTRARKDDTQEDASDAIVASESSWIVIRNKAHYRLLGTTAEEHGRGGSAYDIPIDPPKALVGTEERSIPWDAILDTAPDAIDAYNSPDGDLVLILTPKFLSVYDQKDGKIGERLFRRSIESANVIAAQWATGSTVNHWSDVIMPLLKDAPFQPAK